MSRYRQPLIRVAHSKLGDRATAEDAVQETLLAVFTARHTYDPSFPFRTWIWTILLNFCRRQLKRQSHRPRQLTGLSPAIANPAEPASRENGLSHVLRIERRERLADLLDELPETKADALRLRFFGGLKYKEIAETMNCSLNGAKLRVRTGLSALAERLHDEQGEDR